MSELIDWGGAYAGLLRDRHAWKRKAEIDPLEIEMEAAFREQQMAITREPQPWRDWLYRRFPHVASAPMADRHIALWDWFTALQPREWQQPRIEIWGRGGAKSASGELGVSYVGSETLSRAFVLYVSDTQDQADSHVQNVAGFLETSGEEPALNRFGRAKGWRRSQLRTARGFNVAAFGVDAGQRGIRIEQYRPDLIIFDDVDSRHDSPLLVRKKIECITQSILPTGAPWCVVLFLQNLIHANSVAAQLAGNRADFLLDRNVAIVEPAVRDLEVEIVPQEDGRKPLYRIIKGEATWAGQSIAVCEKQINEWGLETFLREAQHEVRAGSTFFDPFEEARHVPPTAPFTPDNPPPSWWHYYAGMDWGYADPFAFCLVGVDERGCEHTIESWQETRLTNSHQAGRVRSTITKWGIDPRDVLIGYDESMEIKPHKDGAVGEAPIESFYREGLTCVPVQNTLDVQSAGFSTLRDLMRVPGSPSPTFLVWPGFNTDMIFALSNATHDRTQAEKIAHDICSHLAHARRYAKATRPEAAQEPPKKREQLTPEEIRRAGIEEIMRRQHAKAGRIEKRDESGEIVRNDDGEIEWEEVSRGRQMTRPFGR